MAARILLSCLGCGKDFDGELVNCPDCVPRMTPEHGRLKEAHTIAAFTAAMDAAGIPDPEDEPRTIMVLGEKDAKGRQRVVEVDNSEAHDKAHSARRTAEEGFYQGAKGTPKIHRGAALESKEAHVILGNGDAIAFRAKVALEALAVKAKTERDARVKALADSLKANPASVLELVHKVPEDELAAALKSLGVDVTS